MSDLANSTSAIDACFRVPEMRSAMSFSAGATLTSVAPLVLGVASTLLWAVVSAAVIGRFFPWEPRA